MIVFDIETNGLLDDLDKVHCIWTYDTDTQEFHGFDPSTIEDGLQVLQNADVLIGHNIQEFDIPAIQKVYPDWKPKGIVRDTLLLSQLVFADLRERDFVFCKKNPEFPKKYIGSHGLRAWGYRIGNLKDDYEGDFKEWSPEMHSYCKQDVTVTASLWDRLMAREPSPESIELEHQVARIIRRQEKYGFRFDEQGAADLYARLSARRSDLDSELARAFPPWEVEEEFIPARNNKTRGYVQGVPFIKTRTVEFNPNSRDHIALKLRELGWEPKEFTPEGKARVDEEVLEALKYPEAKLLAEHFLIQKRIGQVAEGRNAWLKKSKNGRLHGRIKTCGAVTGRMTHLEPNMAQVPSTRVPYGDDCRRLFSADRGCVLVGCDADALELRCLAGYMAHYDGGQYVQTVLHGDKAAGTDMHSINASVLGCDRDTAKTWFYAYIYGAGDAKLGIILGKGFKAGRESRASFLRSLPALAQLVQAVQSAAESRGYLKGLDGRKLAVRSSHAALNTLLQSAGAVFMKKALVILDADLHGIGLVPGRDFEFVANIHDEWQINLRQEHAEEVGRRAVAAIRGSGTAFGFRCPLDAQFSIGRTWADTH